MAPVTRHQLRVDRYERTFRAVVVAVAVAVLALLVGAALYTVPVLRTVGLWVLAGGVAVLVLVGVPAALAFRRAERRANR